MNRISTPLKKKKGNTGMYFTEDTQQAILDYCDEGSTIKREIIFKQKIYKPLAKICEIYYNKINTPYLDKVVSSKDCQSDCLSHLVTNVLSKFKDNKGKAFSYLSIAARNFYIIENDKAYVAYKLKNNPQNFDDIEIIDDEILNKEYNIEFINRYYKFMEWAKTHIPTLPYSPNTKRIMFDLLEFMNDFDEIEHYYKLEVNNALRRRYSSTEASLKSAKDKLKNLWLQYINNVENEIDNAKPNVLYKKSQDFQYTQEMWDYVIKNYDTHNRNWTMTALSIKLGIPSYRVKEILDTHNKQKGVV
jgi:hypothetical protein